MDHAESLMETKVAPEPADILRCLDCSNASVLRPGMVLLRGALTEDAQRLMVDMAFRRGEQGEVEGVAHGFQNWWAETAASPEDGDTPGGWSLTLLARMLAECTMQSDLSREGCKWRPPPVRCTTRLVRPTLPSAQ